MRTGTSLPKLSPFELELERNLEQAIKRLELGVTGAPESVPSGVLLQAAPTPRSASGAPVGGNKAWQYHQMVRAAVLRNPRWNIIVE